MFLNNRNSESVITEQYKVNVRQKEAGGCINLTENLVRFEKSSLLLLLNDLSECTCNMWLSAVIKTI